MNDQDSWLDWNIFNKTKFFESTNAQQQLQVKVTEVINFIKMVIKHYMRAISN